MWNRYKIWKALIKIKLSPQSYKVETPWLLSAVSSQCCLAVKVRERLGSADSPETNATFSLSTVRTSHAFIPSFRRELDDRDGTWEERKNERERERGEEWGWEGVRRNGDKAYIYVSLKEWEYSIDGHIHRGKRQSEAEQQQRHKLRKKRRKKLRNWRKKM